MHVNKHDSLPFYFDLGKVMKIIIGKPQQYHFKVSFTGKKKKSIMKSALSYENPPKWIFTELFLYEVIFLRDKILNSLPMKTAVFTLLKL